MEDIAFISTLLATNSTAFVQFVNKQSETQFIATPNDKWSIGQNVEHLIRSLSPVNLALLLPGFVLRFQFGKPNRQPRTYTELVNRYHEKLQAGGRASARFVPPPVLWNEKEKKLAAFVHQTDIMNKRVNSWSEAQLDNYLLPHPLLGKLTVREMLFFSGYHIEHHLKLLEGRV
ncbi:MAG: DinB family protein [Cyclobacteriaceae bacterium]|nr:DinB family protein [Cyclobacteriaceae bacterium]